MWISSFVASAKTIFYSLSIKNGPVEISEAINYCFIFS